MPEITKTQIRISVARQRKDDVIRTITISQEQGIDALYSVHRKITLTYIFAKSKWTVERAKIWINQNHKKINIDTMTKQMKGFVKKISEKGEIIVAVASDDTMDRQGDSLNTKAWKLADYKRNPVLQWAHNPTIPAIGKAENIRIEGEKLLFRPVFAKTAQAKEIAQLYKEGILNAFSVGFREIEQKAGDVALELLEISGVNVPANPKALALARQKGLNTKLIGKVKMVTKKKKATQKKELDVEKLNKSITNIEKDIAYLAKGFKILKPKVGTAPGKATQGRKQVEANPELQLVQAIDKQLEVVIKGLKMKGQ